MRIHVVCRQNQARSIITSAILRKLLPDIQIFSSGIEAKTGSPIPIHISDIAERWGLESIDRLSTNFLDSNPAFADDLVICADKSIYSHLAKLIDTSQLLNAQDFALAKFLIPKDPVGMSLYATETELAKLIVTSVCAIESRRNLLESENASALLYEEGFEDLVQEIIKSWLESKKGLVIDLNLRIPNKTVWQSLDFPIKFFDPRRINEFVNIEPKNAILVSRFEFDNLARVFTGKFWSNFMRSAKVPLLLLVRSNDKDPVLGPEVVLSLIHTSHLITLNESH